MPAVFPYNPQSMKTQSMTTQAIKICITATLFIATAAIAQQTHNQYEPQNATGAGQKLLAQFAGDWDLVKTFFPD